MIRILRKINLVLLALVALQGIVLWRTQFASAVTVTPFLYEPFYGNWQESTKKYDAYPVRINASFDHNLPNYSTNQSFTFRDGSVVNVVPGTKCGSGGGERNCYDGHPGIDYNLFYAPVTAAYSGTVQYAGWNSTTHDNVDLGLMIRLEHKVGGSSTANYRTIYGHLSALVGYTGQTIEGKWLTYQGTTWRWHPQIATSGSTGNSPGPHLHFEVRTWYNNAWRVVDPFGWTGGTDPWVTAGGPSSVNLWTTPRRQYPPPGDGPLVIDDNNTNTGGFSANSGWTPIASGGYNNGGLRHRTNSLSETGWAKWNPTVPIRTVYEIQVYIPAYPPNYETARTHAARYQIYNRVVAK